jgi:hypothetical protein
MQISSPNGYNHSLAHVTPACRTAASYRRCRRGASGESEVAGMPGDPVWYVAYVLQIYPLVLGSGRRRFPAAGSR